MSSSSPSVCSWCKSATDQHETPPASKIRPLRKQLPLLVHFCKRKHPNLHKRYFTERPQLTDASLFCSRCDCILTAYDAYLLKGCVNKRRLNTKLSASKTTSILASAPTPSCPKSSALCSFSTMLSRRKPWSVSLLSYQSSIRR